MMKVGDKVIVKPDISGVVMRVNIEELKGRVFTVEHMVRWLDKDHVRFKELNYVLPLECFCTLPDSSLRNLIEKRRSINEI